jgi:hypothetical protein
MSTNDTPLPDVEPELQPDPADRDLAEPTPDSDDEGAADGATDGAD